MGRGREGGRAAGSAGETASPSGAGSMCDGEAPACARSDYGCMLLKYACELREKGCMIVPLPGGPTAHLSPRIVRLGTVAEERGDVREWAAE